ncbi:hypothetical protein BGP_3345 [Beggiatoa sp. PS]|nr:hypothetical protein BGP_3345 [Beggiatoa sp. PS]
MTQVKTALTRYAVTNNRLPCPSDNPEVGIEVNTVANCTIEGNLPWVNLGVGRYDAWGNPLRYRVIQQYTDHIVESNGDLNRDLNRDNLSPTSNTPSVKDAQGNNLVNANDLVAIILSDGKNGETEQQALREQFSFNIGQNTYLFKGLKGISDLLLVPALAELNRSGSNEDYTKCNAIPNCDDLLNVITIPHLRAEMRQGPTTIMITSSKPVLDDTVYTPTLAVTPTVTDEPTPVEEPPVVQEPPPDVIEEPQITEPPPEVIEEPPITEPPHEVIEEPPITEPPPDVIEEPPITEPPSEVVEEPPITEPPEVIEESPIPCIVFINCPKD